MPRATSAACASLAALLAACDSTTSIDAAAHAPDLDRMHAACVEAMLKSTCQVMTGPQASSTADVVFVAGVGPVDAKAYRELRASGDAMCSVVQKACQADWAGAQCRTARGLWPPLAPG
jgi:type IV secretory pathway VirB2 component (pilin)